MANRLKWNNHKSTFFEILKAQREKSKYTDATLAVDGKFYPVHKLVLSTCSEYFSDIFERTPCKTPVIVLNDVQCHDIEALLDYIYVGEVDVKQDNLTSLLKTAKCLRIKGLGVPEEYQTKSHKNSISSHDVACAHPEDYQTKSNENSISSQDVAHARPYSPPPKRRKHDSNAALDNTNQTSHIPSHTSSNTDQEVESLFVKVEIDDSMEEKVRFRKEDVYEAGVETDHDPGKVSGYDVSKEDQEPESYDCTSLPGPSSQQFTSSTSNANQDESLVVRVGLEAAKEQDLRVRPNHNYDGAASSDRDPLGGDDGSLIFNTEHNQEYYGSTSVPGSYLQQSGPCISYNQKKKNKRKYKTLFKMANDLLDAGAIIAIVYSTSPGTVQHHGNPYITGFVIENWKLIEQIPGFRDNYTRNIFSPPTKPVSQMSYTESKVFATNLMNKVIGHKKGFGDPSKRPEWFPSEVDWITKRVNKENEAEEAMRQKDFQAIITAYYNYHNIELAPSATTVEQPQSNLVLRQTPAIQINPLSQMCQNS